MNIRKMECKDTDEVFSMMRPFYDSPAVLHKAPDGVLLRVIRDCTGDCPYVEGFVFEADGKTAGYAITAKSYSTEYGGLCVWIEDLYIKEEYRGKGFASAFFTKLEEIYKGKAVRFRLEAEEENTHAVSVYKKNGFSPLPYLQMTKEFNI